MGFCNEIDALKDHALKPFQNEPGKRRFVQIGFVLLCAAVGAGAAAGMAWLEDGCPTSRYLFSVFLSARSRSPSRILNRRLNQTFCRLQLHLRSLIRLALALICFVHDQTVERKG